LMLDDNMTETRIWWMKALMEIWQPTSESCFVVFLLRIRIRIRARVRSSTVGATQE